MGRRLGDPGALLPALYSHNIALMGFDRPEERLAVSTELVQVAERAQAKEWVVRGHYGRFRELLGLCLRPQLDEALAAYGRVANELRQPSHQWLFPLGRSVVALIEGRFAESEALAHESAAIGEQVRDLNAPLFYSCQFVTLRGVEGRNHEVIDRVRKAIAEYAFIPGWTATLAKILAEENQLQEARELMESLDLEAIPRDGSYVVSTALLGQVAAQLHDLERCRWLYEHLLPFAPYNVILGTSGVYYGPVPRYLALMAEALQRFDDAETHFRGAIEMNLRLRSLPFTVFGHLEYGAMLLRSRRGTAGQAKSLIEEALSGARKLGMALAIRDAVALLNQ